MRVRDAAALVFLLVILLGLAFAAATGATAPRALQWRRVGPAEMLEVNGGHVIYREAGRYKIPVMVFCPGD